MHHVFSLLVFCATIFHAGFAAGYSWFNGEQRLNQFQTKYANRKADIFFLIDNSGSLWNSRTGKNGFYDEKTFVSSVLSKIKIAKDGTRVAIIRFSDDATIDINYVTDLNGLNNKCEFNTRFDQIEFTGVMTNMNAAFQRVKEILFGTHSTNVRPWKKFGSSTNVNKVTFLLTDGHWNDGGNPTSAINFIKNEDVELFTIGVTNADKSFLQSAATSADRYFYYNEFKDFRELATHIRGDPYQLDYETEFVPKSKCTITCDQKAFCGCGLLSGKYVCLCKPGYYGSGSSGDCKACPRNTYKDFVGLSVGSCTACPTNSENSGTGSTKKSSCVCNRGFQGNPGSNSECKIKQCLGLRVPADGYTNPSNCGRNYGAECAFHCNSGFKLVGEPLLTCSVATNNVGGAFWSPRAVVPECKRIVCPPYQVLNAVTENGDCGIPDRRVGTKCKYTCLRGYRLVGSQERVCQVDETWSGQATKCEVITCPKLNSLTLSTINDRNCVEKPMRFDSQCIFSCPSGYLFNATKTQSTTRTCLDTGKWDGTFQVCKDEQAPKFTKCPRNSMFTYNTTFRKDFAVVTWKLPEFEDNSMTHDANHKVILKEEHDYKSPHEFKIGTHNIKYTVTDKEGHQEFCEFLFKVVDKEAPYFTSCPLKQTITTKKNSIRVVWDEPQFLDNSGNDPVITSSHLNSGNFITGTQTMVYYTATDGSSNEDKSCRFEVHIERLTCKNPKNPDDGAAACTEFAGSKQCGVFCREGFDFGYPPAISYYCAEAMWNTWPPGRRLPWPDCSKRVDPTSSTLMMDSSFYFSGSCEDAEVQDIIKGKFISAIKNPRVIPPTFCLMHQDCTVANTKVYCGATTSTRRRRRRTAQNEIYIRTAYVVTPQQSIKDQSEFQDVKKKVESHMYNEAKTKLNAIAWRSYVGLDPVKPVTVSHTEPFCAGATGGVVGRCYGLGHGCTERNYTLCQCNSDYGGIEKCIECPKGKYYSLETEKCAMCPDGTYQELPGQFGCKKCPPGFSTFGNDAKNFTACNAICQPGFYSRTGLAPCTPCPFGTYTSKTWSTSCTKCHAGTVTVLPGSKKIEDCGMKCAPGSYSSNGVEPCTPCEKGKCQAKSGQLSCFACDGPKTTYGTGSAETSKCVAVDNCASNPCNNNGQCRSFKDTYECACPPGFKGRNCDTAVSACLSNPCYENAVCVDKINSYVCICAEGFTGTNCDEPLPQCTKHACQNGKCIEGAGSYTCDCIRGWTGTYCEIDADDCAVKPCKNGAWCDDGKDEVICRCPNGYAGDLCEIDIDECASDPCQNNGKCVDKVGAYVCQCAAGYVGQNCEHDENECRVNPCKNRGACVDKQNDFECICLPSFTGKKCETELSEDFDLTFPTYQVRSFSKVVMRKDLYAFTLAFWMRTHDKDNVGTPVSYAVKKGNYVEENAIVLKDYGNLAIQINNQTGYINDPLNDGKWHHVAVTWASSSGIWTYYRDGKKINVANKALAKGEYIRGGGELVLTQEQDYETAENRFSYNPLEAFLGDMSQMTLWDTVLPEREVYNLAGRCDTADKESIVVAWSDFLPNLQGKYHKTTKSHACDQSSVVRLFDVVYGSYIPANNHLTLSGKTLEACASECVNTRLNFECRSFDYALSSQTCHLSAANRETVSLSKSDLSEVHYDYYELSSLDKLGMESRMIRDNQLRASTQRNALSGGKDARANGRKVSGVQGMPDSDGGWIPSSFDRNQYLEVDLGKTMKVTAVETQGADKQSMWVTKYKLQYKLSSGSSWTNYHKELIGNSDDKGRMKRQVTFLAQIIRVLPVQWSPNGIGMRVEFYGRSTEAEGVPLDIQTVTAANSMSCSHSLCHNGGKCKSLPYGFVCICPIGYKGRKCEQALACESPGSPLHGYAQYTAGSRTVTYGCSSGYQISGSGTRSCVNGQWDGVPPSCSNIDECANRVCDHHCQDLPGRYICSCTKGYELYNGKKCIDIDECKKASACSHGCINTAGSYRCTCPAGMKLQSSGTRCEDIKECDFKNGGCEQICVNTYKSFKCQCKGGYKLHSDGRSCEEIRCPTLSKPGYGTMTLVGDAILDNTALFKCQVGYKLVGSDKRTCQADGRWSGIQPRCYVVRCPEVGTIDHGTRSITGSTYGSTVTFTCNRTYRLLGKATRTCQETGTWSGTQPLCLADYCPTLTAPVHGRINGFRTEQGATVGVSCDLGYAVKGTSYRTCQSSRTWSGSDPICELVDCADPGKPVNGYRHGNYYKYNGTINFSCKSNHHLEGASHITCQEDGQWSATKPKCLGRSCGNPGAPYNGFKHGSSHTYGSSVKYSCQQGYTLQGSRQRTCQESTKKWTGDLPTCHLINCGTQHAPNNGFRNGDEFTYNKVVKFDCNPGYKLVGSASRKCQITGQWSGTAPSCVSSPCGSNLHGPAGVLESPNFPNSYDNDLYCTWKITVPTGKKVRLDFTQFMTDAKDIVYIFDTDKTEPIIALSGVSAHYQPLTSTGNSIRVRFVSNSAGSSNGFQIRYSQVACGGMFQATAGVITSPNYKGQYPNNIDCSWLVSLPNRRVGLTFDDFSTEGSYDLLMVYKHPGNPDRILNYSGHILLAGTVVTENYMYLRFTSNRQNNGIYHGFKAYYAVYNLAMK